MYEPYLTCAEWFPASYPPHVALYVTKFLYNFLRWLVCLLLLVPNIFSCMYCVLETDFLYRVKGHISKPLEYNAKNIRLIQKSVFGIKYIVTLVW